MTHDERSPHDREERDGKDQTEGLNAWLDGLATGTRMSGVERDETLVAAEWLTANYEDTVDAHLDPTRQASTWRALLGAESGSVPEAAAATVTEDDATPAPREIHHARRRAMMRRSAFAPTAMPPGASELPASERAVRRASPPPSGWRLVGSRSLGVAATLLLVAMLAASGFAVYLTAPRQQTGEPSSVPAIAAASATSEAATPSVPVDARDVVAQACSAQPVDFNQLLNEIAPSTYGSSSGHQFTWGALPFTTTGVTAPAPLVHAFTFPASRPDAAQTDSTTPHFGADTITMYELPSAPPPNSNQIDAALGIFGQWMNCSPLRAASLSTDWLYERNIYLYGGGGAVLARLWQDSQQTTPESPPFEPGQPTGYRLFNWVMLDQSHIGAYISLPQIPSDGASFPRSYGPEGYVVFAIQGDGQILVDDYRDQTTGLCGQHTPSEVCQQ